MLVAAIEGTRDVLRVHARAVEYAASDACEAGEEREFGNDRQGLSSDRKWLREFGVQRVVLEPTGRSHCRVHQSFFNDGFEVLLVKPARSQRFAEAKGDLVKSDLVDAPVLAAYGRAHPEPAPSEPNGASMEWLESMLATRECLVDSHASLRQTGKEVDKPEV